MQSFAEWTPVKVAVVDVKQQNPGTEERVILPQISTIRPEKKLFVTPAGLKI
jgi:hypothetical protein